MGGKLCAGQAETFIQGSITGVNIGAGILAGVVYQFQIAAGSYGSTIQGLAFQYAVVGSEWKVVVVFAVDHPVLGVVSGRSTGLDLVDGFSGLGVADRCGYTTGECDGFQLSSTTHIADGYDHALHFFRIDDVFKSIAGTHITTELSHRYGRKHTITKVQGYLIVGPAGHAEQFSQSRASLFRSRTIHCGHKLPLAVNAAHIAELIQPAIFVVDPFDVDVHGTIAHTIGQVEILILQHTLFEQEEISCVGRTESQLVVAEQEVEHSIGSGTGLVHKGLAHSAGSHCFKWHADAIHCGCVRYHWQKPWHKIDAVFLGVHSQYGGSGAWHAHTLAVNQGRIDYGCELLLPAGIGGIGPVYGDIGQVYAVDVCDILCGLHTEHLEIALSRYVAFGSVADQVGQAYHAVASLGRIYVVFSGVEICTEGQGLSHEGHDI